VTHDIRPLDERDVSSAAAVLGRAFHENPSYTELLAHLAAGERRLAAVTRLKQGFTEACLGHARAEVVWVEGRIAGVQLVCEPGQYPPGIAAQLRIVRGSLGAGLSGIKNLLTANGVMEKRHPKYAHQYLFVLGVDPAFQGRGLGRALLQAMNRRCDAARLPAYLETDKESSVKLYQSVGYAITGQTRVPVNRGFPLWLMTRPAAES
jgi:ribosomal protein S18 acetylase RimI-like enzyme